MDHVRVREHVRVMDHVRVREHVRVMDHVRVIDHVRVRAHMSPLLWQVLAEHCDEVWFCKWSPNGRFLATGSKDYTVGDVVS